MIDSVLVRWNCEVCDTYGDRYVEWDQAATLHRCFVTLPLWPWLMEAAGMRR